MTDDDINVVDNHNIHEYLGSINEVEEWFDSLNEDEKAEVVEYAQNMKPFIEMVINKHEEEIK
jgi:hypothetical protein